MIIRQFKLPTLVFLVIANMLGAGVFTTSGFALSDLGSASRVLAAWLIGGIIALCGAYSYGLIAKKITESGGEYIFLTKNAHPSIGFVAGLLSLIVGFAGATAYAAMTVEVYLGLPLHQLKTGTIATLVVVLGWILHALHIQAGAKIQNGLVVIKCIALITFIGFAFTHLPTATPRLTFAHHPFSIAAFATTLIWISFSYSGFNAAIYVAGEAHRPERNVPRALIIGTIITVLLYLALNSAFVAIPPYTLVSGKADIALKAAGYIGGPLLTDSLRVIIIIALITSISSLFMAGPRVCAKMADDGLLPKLFSSQKKAPLMAATMQAMLVITMIWFSQLRDLLSYLGMTLAASTLITVCTAFHLYKRPLKSYSIRLIAPLVFIALTALSIVLAAYNNPLAALVSLLTFISGFGLYYILKRLKSAPAATRVTR